MTEGRTDVVCIDASLAVKLVLIEESTDVALDLYQGWSDDSKQIIAPRG